MNTRDILNAHLRPEIGQNVRRKEYSYYDTQTLATGATEYYFFVTPPGNIFQRNKKMPLSGSEVFFVEEISAYIDLNITTTALANALNELMQQSFLEISIDNRQVCKLPGLDFINFMYGNNLADQVPVTVLQPRLGGKSRKLPLPIIINSTSAFQFKFVTTSAAATAFNTVNMRLSLKGLQLDKLDSFYWDNLKNNLFQQVPVTYYDTQVIASGNQTTYQLFANANRNPVLFSATFPLSDITTMSIQNIEVYVNQPDTPIEPTTIYNSRLQNILQISVDDVVYYNGNLQECLSMFAGYDQTLTTTPDLDVVSFLEVRQSKTFKVPLNIPAMGKVVVELIQPASSLGITGEITTVLRGEETRRVA